MLQHGLLSQATHRKLYKHRSKVFLTFVDVRKAYNSIPREAMWKALTKLGIPEALIKIVKSFHEGMSAQIILNGRPSEEDIKVDNGLRQGCSMAPTLFNVYACLVVHRDGRRELRMWMAWVCC